MRRLALALLVLVAGCAAASSAAPAERALIRPNVVVIMTDDQTVDDLRVMRNVRHLLVERGTTFDQSVVSNPLCCPSRAAFLTGQYGHNNHVQGNSVANGISQLDQSNTLPVWLSDAGYHTIFVGKYLNEYKRFMYRRIPPGWSDWNAGLQLSFFDHTMNRNGKIVRFGSRPEDYQSDVYTRIAVDAIRSSPTGAPLFLWLSYFAPHQGGGKEDSDPDNLMSTIPAPRHAARFPNVQLPRDPSFDEADVSDKPAAIRARPVFGDSTTLSMTTTYRHRLQSLLAVDEGVAKVVAALKRSGRLDDTLILFTSDNGFLQGQHRIVNHKELPYEPSIRVPLVVRGPGVPQNVHLQQLVANVDLAPTIAAAAKVVPWRDEDGRSLLPLLADPAAAWPRDVLLERGPGVTVGGPRQYTAIRTARYVYVEYATGEKELYDLQVDPFELESKHDDPAYAQVEADLATRLATLRDCAGATCREAF